MSTFEDLVTTNRDDVKSFSTPEMGICLGEASETRKADQMNNSSCLNIGYSSYKIDANRNKSGFYVDGLIQGTPVTWKVDTGAKKSFITEDLFNTIPLESRPVLESVRRQFVTASGQNLNILGTTYMTLNFEDFETDIRIFVGGVSQNLLGEDFYTKFKCNWDHDNGGLTINIPANDSFSRFTNWIRTCENVSIPPGNEAVVQSTLTRKESSEGTPLVSSEFLLKYDLLIARTLLDASSDNVYLRLFNTGNQTVTIEKAKRVALFSPVINVLNCERIESDNVNLVGEIVQEELPGHLIPVFEDGRTHLSDDEANEFKLFLLRRIDTFSDPDGRRGRTNLGEHRISLSDNRPFKEATRNVPLFKREILDKEIQKLEDLGLIEKSRSPWSSQLVLAQKKDKSWRVCVDYR